MKKARCRVYSVSGMSYYVRTDTSHVFRVEVDDLPNDWQDVLWNCWVPYLGY